jgi:hypothetical protein
MRRALALHKLGGRIYITRRRPSRRKNRRSQQTERSSIAVAEVKAQTLVKMLFGTTPCGVSAWVMCRASGSGNLHEAGIRHGCLEVCGKADWGINA